MNKKQGLFTGIAVILLAAMVILAGCPMDDDGDDGGDNDGVTGLSTIVYTDVTLQGEGASTLTVDKETNIRDGYELSITKGKLTLEFFKPLSTGPIDEDLNGREEYWLFGRTDGDYKLTFDPAGGGRVGVKERGGWDLNEEEASLRYGISRNSTQKDDENNPTFQISSQIAHVYVTGDVRITREEKEEIVVEDDDWRSGKYTAIDLPLKTGWNLVQFDRKETFAENEADNTVVITVKIADKDIPWIYWEEEEEEEDD
jgi:hypothetical protein